MNANNGKIQVAEKFRHLNPHHNLTDSITGGNFHRIGMKGKNWKLITGGETYSFISDNGKPLQDLDVVIVGINPATSKLFYPPGTYQEDSVNAPTCASVDGIAPDAGVPIPQSTTCAVCPNNVWKPNRGGKDCQDHKRVAIVLLPYMKTRPALEKPLVEPVFFKVPPASLKVFKAYCDSLQHRGAHFASVITRVSFEPDKQFQMMFEYVKPLTDSDSDLIIPLLDDAGTRNILGGMLEFKPATPAVDIPQETGFAAAFGKQATPVEATANVPAKRGPGRPRKTVEEAKPATEASAAQQPAEGEGDASAFEEVQEDSELDSMMNQVLGNKVGKMMS
jgi:hypothetical protein